MKNNIKRSVFDSYPMALDALVTELNAHEFSPEEYHIVLCPDRYTQTVEQALFCGGKGALDLEVLTLSRLSRRVNPTAKTLPQEGGIMIMSRAISAAQKDLRYYARAALFDDFARAVYMTMQQIASSDVQIEDIKATGSAKIKLDDLARIKKEYDIIKGEYKDSPDRLIALMQSADCELIKNTHFYAIGYADITKLITRLFAVISDHAKSFVLYDAPPPETKRANIDLFGAPDKISEYKHVAAQIRDYVYRGGRYEDVAVVCDDRRALNRILNEYLIPTYTDESKPLYFTPPLVALDNIYKLHSTYKRRNAIDCDVLVALAKNPYIGCDVFDAEILLNDVRGKALTLVPQDYEFKCGAASAKRVLDGLNAFMRSDFNSAVKSVLEFYKFADTAQAMGGTDGVTPILNLVELLERYSSGDFDIDAKAFFSASRAVNVNTVPRETDCVTVTMPSALRMTAVKKLFITDFNEGVMPIAVADTGLISDVELNMMGGVVEPTVKQRNKRSREELKAVVVNAGDVYISYCSAGDAKPAAILRELAHDINMHEYDDELAELYITKDAEVVAKHASTPAAARELVARKLSLSANSVDSATVKSSAVYAEFQDKIDIKRKGSISVSEISSWFRCPYYRFLQYSVSLSERKSGFGAPDFGTVIHEFMNKLLDAEPYDCSDAAVKSLLDEVLDEKKIKLDPATYSRILGDAKDYAEENVRIIKKGEYKVAEREFEFGKKTNKAAPDIALGNSRRLRFEGKIDRFDVIDSRARVIDYKTGNKTFSLKECLDGTDMQLPLYAYALKHADKPYDVTGMFYVRAAGKYYTEKPDKSLSGRVIKDVDVVREYDIDLQEEDLQSDVLSGCVKTTDKKGTYFSTRSNMPVERSDMDDLITQCKINADVAVDEICEGYILRSPVKKACDFCPYVGICGGGEVRAFDYGGIKEEAEGE
ncbi:MAG: PD-(D/E)XK nuclease family protein [Clostridiales bacterium]|nr:PD-(D/E)XK nuclease family protein [Clostridiales bacterium]